MKLYSDNPIIEMPAYDLLSYSGNPLPKIAAAVGAGGKTTLLTEIAKTAPSNLRIVIATTTKMFMPGREERFVTPCAMPESFPIGITFCGYPMEDGSGKMAGDAALIERLSSRCDLLLVEADGSKRLPMKFPAEHEPVLPECDLVFGVIGLSALGKSLEESCHRANIAAECLHTGQSHIITEADMAFVLTQSCGQKKNVGDTPYLAVVSQSDLAPEAAKRIVNMIKQKGESAFAVSHR